MGDEAAAVFVSLLVLVVIVLLIAVCVWAVIKCCDRCCNGSAAPNASLSTWYPSFVPIYPAGGGGGACYNTGCPYDAGCCYDPGCSLNAGCYA